MTAKETKKIPFRMDFVIENPELVGEDKDADKKHIRFNLVPDPRVWERMTRNGEDGYFNKSDNTFVPWSVLSKMIEHLPGLPITYNPPPGFSDTETYLKKSRERLAKDVEESRKH